MGRKMKRYTPEFRQQMVELHRTGRAYVELSEQFGVMCRLLQVSARQLPESPYDSNSR